MRYFKNILSACAITLTMSTAPGWAATYTFNSEFITARHSSLAGSFVAYDNNSDGFISLNELATMNILYSSGDSGGPSAWAYVINLGFLTSFSLNLNSLLTSLSTQYPSGDYINDWTAWTTTEFCSIDADIPTYACPGPIIPGPDQLVVNHLRDTSVKVLGSETPSPVPLPAGGILLLSGLGAIAAIRRRKKHTA